MGDLTSLLTAITVLLVGGKFFTAFPIYMSEITLCLHLQYIM
jgi:hypothetical protein